MLKQNWMKGWMRRSEMFVALLVVLLAITAGAQTVPSIVVTSATTISNSGMSAPGKVVQDTCGNIYELEAGGNLLEIPEGGGPSIYITNQGSIYSGDGLLGGLTIDTSNNLYVGSKWNGYVLKIPSTNCVPQPGAASQILNGSIGSFTGYWYDPGDIATDAAGDAFVVTDSFGGGSGGIFMQIATGTLAGTGVAVTSGAKGVNQITDITVDAAGDVFFTASGSGNVYEIPVASYGTSNATVVISSGINTALGVAFDSLGDLFIGDSGAGKIFEVPNAIPSGGTTASLQYKSMFLVASGLTINAPITLSSDGRSIFYTNSSSNIYQQTIGNANFGSVAVGSSASSTISVAFNAAVTPTAFTLATSGTFGTPAGTCAAGTSYTAGQSCTYTAKFTPLAPGASRAGFALTNSSGAALATAYVSGIGTGAGITVDAGKVSSVGGGFKAPQAVVLDASGNSYFADPGANAVYEFKLGSTTAISIGTGLSKPSGVAVDGFGDVLISDTGNNRIVEVPVVNGALSNSAQVTITPVDSKGNAAAIAGAILSGPTGLTADVAGNLYIADTGNNRIVYLPFEEGWNTSAASVLGSGLTAPLATAIDAVGNLFIASSGSGQIFKLPAPVTSGVQQLAAVGYSNPSSLATDASGSLFVVSQGSGVVLRIPNIAGALNPNTAIEAGFGIANPYGVAVDAYGNLYVADSADAAAYMVTRTTTSEAFGDWAVGSPSGALPIYLENEGNQSLVFANPYSTGSGNTGDFTLSSTAANVCGNSATLAVGAGCELDATFLPTATGARTETLVLNSNAVNVAAPQVVLSGNGATLVATKTALAITSPASGTPFFGQPLTLTATATSSSGTPAGAADLVVDGVISGKATLSSGGVATFSLPNGLTGGSHSLQAVYLGNTSFDGSTSTILLLTVTTAPTTSTLVITTPNINPMSALSGASVTFNITVASTGVGIPTGTVKFVTGTTTLGSVALAPAVGGTFQASLTTTALPVGTDLVTATYSGDANYIGSSASGTVVVVSSPTLILSSTGTSLTSSTTGGTNSTITFNATSEGGWNGLITYQCLASSLPVNSICVFSPGQVTMTPSTASANYPPAASASQMWIVANNPPNTPGQSSVLWWMGGLSGLALCFVRRRLMRGAWATITMMVGVVLLALSASGLLACTSAAYSTPTGTTTVTVLAYADPYVTGSTTTQPCGVNTTTKLADPTLAPCSVKTYQVSLTVQ
jgi:sugar lactone lactonase YvrE